MQQSFLTTENKLTSRDSDNKLQIAHELTKWKQCMILYVSWQQYNVMWLYICIHSHTNNCKNANFSKWQCKFETRSLSPHLLLHPYRIDGGTEIKRSLYTWRSHSPPVGIPGPPGACASAWSPPAGWRTHWGPPLFGPCCPYRCSWGSPQEDYTIDWREINKYVIYSFAGSSTKLFYQ